MERILILSLLLPACAHMPSGQNHSVVTYACHMDGDMCKLVDKAAARVTAQGFLTIRDDSFGNLIIEPAADRSVFFGETVLTVGHMLPVLPGVMESRPVMARVGGTVEVHAKRGGLVRDKDLVDDFEDLLILGRR